jgi:hypothetical protein
MVEKDCETALQKIPMGFRHSALLSRFVVTTEDFDVMSSIELLGSSMHRKNVHEILMESQPDAGSRPGFRGLADSPAPCIRAGRG